MPKYTKRDLRIDYPHEMIEAFNQRKQHARMVSKQRSQARRLRDDEQAEALIGFVFGHASKLEG